MSGFPPIVAASQRLLAECEQAVATFARSYRYEFGADLRKLARRALQCALRAWRDHSRKDLWIERLSWLIDEMKSLLQVGADIRAFASRRQFEHVARIADDVGRQVGGWKRHQQSRQTAPSDQNAAPERQSQRVKTLSTRAASNGANR